MLEKFFKWVLSVITSIFVLVVVRNFNAIAQKIAWKIKCLKKKFKSKETKDEEFEKKVQALNKVFQQNLDCMRLLQEKKKELDEREARIQEIEKRLLQSEEAVEI